MLNSINSTNNYYQYNKNFDKAQSSTNSVEQKAIACTPIREPRKKSLNFAQNTIIQTQNTLSQPVTQLRTKEELEKYGIVAQNLDTKEQKILNILLKTGILLSNNSNDKSTVLDNLANICTQPRCEGLDEQVILKETINAIANPYSITQKFGNIPNSMIESVVQNENTQIVEEAQKLQNEGKPIQKGLINKESLDVISSCCVAASIEFNLAKNQPAEFARMISEVSTPKQSIEKTININNISENRAEAMWLLDEFKIDYKDKSMDEIIVNIAPDKNAIVRAQIQSIDKDPLERSVVDVLLQSTFMNVGSQKSYNTLTDLRTGKYNPDPKGLTDIEKNLTEVLATNKRKISVNYQNLDEDGKITGYECDLKTMYTQITDALKMGENVIIGYTFFGEDKIVKGGHEITIVGLEKDKHGNEYFICNDTDDDKPEPIKYKVDEFLPQIHHAGLPKEVLKEDVEFVQNWKENLKAYKEYKKAS